MNTLRYRTTRFITYVKRNYERHSDVDLHDFAKWILEQPYSLTNIHAGVEQLILFIQENNPSTNIKNGFVKWCLIYQHDPVNLLPKHLKESPEIIAMYASTVFEESLD